jgi:hypothetical protein
MPQIYDMGPPALLPLQRKACWGFFEGVVGWFFGYTNFMGLWRIKDYTM